MKQNQFSPEQLIGILQQAQRGEKSISQICREHGIGDITFYRWRKKYGSLKVAEAQRLKELEKQNARLKHRLARLLAERDLEIDALKEFLSKK